ncbi:hypothetical protein [Xanthobacter flavus]|uniref:hypothetical protein n=1 Tax=Xanthobacter flavus TaxID=281 RepID=UPI001D2B457A|nr:hypothetical protein [Xanthobacter flavus]MBP2149979.1 hypothetical protein [Xanthobacter flavus]
MQCTDIRPQHARPSQSSTVLASLDEAADFLRTLPIAEHTEPLIDVMEAADEPEMEPRAWQAFETFACAMGLRVRLVA